MQKTFPKGTLPLTSSDPSAGGPSIHFERCPPAVLVYKLFTCAFLRPFTRNPLKRQGDTQRKDRHVHRCGQEFAVILLAENRSSRVAGKNFFAPSRPLKNRQNLRTCQLPPDQAHRNFFKNLHGRRTQSPLAKKLCGDVHTLSPADRRCAAARHTRLRPLKLAAGPPQKGARRGKAPVTSVK